MIAVDRVIFLDIDGVFNCVGSMMAFGTPMMFDEVALCLFARLCEQTDAKIVVSSAWRIGRGLHGLREIFHVRGAVAVSERIIDKTPSLQGVRGEEIACWSASNKHGDYIIIDDDADMLPEQLPRFVQTSTLTGFRAPEYAAALHLFEPEHIDLKSLRGYNPLRHLKWDEVKEQV